MSEPLLDLSELPQLDNALCAETDPELFHPEQGSSNRPAKRVCAACSARVQCLDWALDHPTERGIWGGTTQAERLAILKKRARGEVAA